MENSQTDSELQQCFNSPPRRRRSTFFERRDSIVAQHRNEIEEQSEIEKSEEIEKHNEHLSRYYDQLLHEKEQWKKEVNNRRHKYHDLKQQYQMEMKSTSKTSMFQYSYLSNEDIEFLKGKINLSKFAESQSELNMCVQQATVMYGRANELDNVVLDYCKDVHSKITKHILENSHVEH